MVNKIVLLLIAPALLGMVSKSGFNIKSPVRVAKENVSSAESASNMGSQSIPFDSLSFSNTIGYPTNIIGGVGARVSYDGCSYDVIDGEIGNQEAAHNVSGRDYLYVYAISNPIITDRVVVEDVGKSASLSYSVSVESSFDISVKIEGEISFGPEFFSCGVKTSISAYIEKSGGAGTGSEYAINYDTKTEDTTSHYALRQYKTTYYFLTLCYSHEIVQDYYDHNWFGGHYGWNYKLIYTHFAFMTEAVTVTSYELEKI